MVPQNTCQHPNAYCMLAALSRDILRNIEVAIATP